MSKRLYLVSLLDIMNQRENFVFSIYMEGRLTQSYYNPNSSKIDSILVYINPLPNIPPEMSEEDHMEATCIFLEDKFNVRCFTQERSQNGNRWLNPKRFDSAPYYERLKAIPC